MEQNTRPRRPPGSWRSAAAVWGVVAITIAVAAGVAVLFYLGVMFAFSYIGQHLSIYP